MPKDSLVVDVGGGVGASSMTLAKNIPDINIVVQDLPSVAEAGATVRPHNCHTSKSYLHRSYGNLSYRKQWNLAELQFKV